MTLEEMAQLVSKRTKVEQAAVQKVLRAALSTIKEQIEKDERTRVPGFGVFIRKPGKEPGTTRIVFKPLEKKSEGEGTKKEEA
jgi:nucleoid DNA-binding protein